MKKSEELYKQALTLLEMAAEATVKEEGVQSGYYIGLAQVRKVPGSFKGGEVNHEVIITSDDSASIAERVELACNLLSPIPINHWGLVLQRIYETRMARVELEVKEEENGVTILESEKEVSMEDLTKMEGMGTILGKVRKALGRE